MSRSIKKGPWIDPKLLKKMSKVKSGDKTVIKTWSRDCMISPEMVGFTFGVQMAKPTFRLILLKKWLAIVWASFP